MDNNIALDKLRELERTVRTLKNMAYQKDVISADIRLAGSILLNDGISRLAENLSLPVEMEPYEDESGEVVGTFRILRIGDAEILQLDDD